MVQAGPPVLPKRLSTHRRPLHASPTLRSETVTRMAHQAAANPTQSFAVPALHLEAASIVRTGRRSRNKVLPAGHRLALLACAPLVSAWFSGVMCLSVSCRQAQPQRCTATCRMLCQVRFPASTTFTNAPCL